MILVFLAFLITFEVPFLLFREKLCPSIGPVGP